MAGRRCEVLDRENTPVRRVLDRDGNHLSVKVSVIDPPIDVEIWKVQIGKSQLFLIDTSVESNAPWNRCISDG
jgi:starch phosphorylase